MGLPAMADSKFWPSGGLTLENTRYQAKENSIGPDNVGVLQPRWVFTAGGDVSATPAVDATAVYFPDWGGNLFKVDRKTGEVLWQVSIPDITGVAGNLARATPALQGNYVVIGDQGGGVGGGARLMAFHKDTGALIWMTVVDSHPAAIVTQSAAIFDRKVFVGTSSKEEVFAAVIPGYPCCSFRGAMMAFNLDTGALLWKTYTAAEGFSGNAVWGSTPAIDRKRKQVYIATGNNYSAPDDVIACIEAAGEDPDAQRACIPSDNLFDAILALDYNTGEVRWSTNSLPFDIWTLACLFELPSCDLPESPDFDFAQAPMLYSVMDKGRPRDQITVGQKSGQVWTLDPATGEVIWITGTGPDGVAGGIMWGSATDGETIYVSNANNEQKPWVLVDGTNTTAGMWTALNASTGEILWQTSNPAEGGGVNARAGAAVSLANGLVYACSLDPLGHMYALNAKTGAVEWSYVSGGSCNAGAAISDGQVFWGSGYTIFGPPPDYTGSDKFYAFELPAD